MRSGADEGKPRQGRARVKERRKQIRDKGYGMVMKDEGDRGRGYVSKARRNQRMHQHQAFSISYFIGA